MESRAPGRALSAPHILLSDIPVNHIIGRLTGIPDMVEKERGRGMRAGGARGNECG